MVRSWPWASDDEVAVFDLGFDVGVEFLAHFTAGTFDGDDVRFFIDFDFYAFREGDG